MTTPGPHLERPSDSIPPTGHPVVADNDDAIVQAVRQMAESDGNYSTEIAGVRIEKCDSHGNTRTTDRLKDATKEIKIMVGQRDDLQADLAEARKAVDDSLTALSVDQQQRQEAIYASATVLRGENRGGVFSKGTVQPGQASALIAVAHFICTGQRDYLMTADQVLVLTDRPDHGGQPQRFPPLEVDS